jgi:hypothetical protein
MLGYIFMILGVISFLSGNFFLGKFQGQNECNEKKDNGNNYKGGIAGIFMGCILSHQPFTISKVDGL